MQIPDLKIPDNIQRTMNRLRTAGHEAYVVGGCVRDALMGNAPHDWDITTSATPMEIRQLFAELPQIDAGIKHGTVMIMIDHSPVEITTFRVDGEYSDGRRPDNVTFTSDITEDLSRRDFTINACAADEAGLIDPYGGRLDLEHRLIRCVGDPIVRFTEDSLRILRGIRFAAVLNFQVEEKTRAAMFACKHLLVNVSKERVTAELKKALLGENIKNVLLEFRDILIYIIPEIKPLVGFNQKNPYHIYDIYEHTINAVDYIESDTILRMTMLLHDIGKPACFSLDKKGIGHFYGHNLVSARIAETILHRMRYSTEEINAITKLIQFHDYKIAQTPVGVKKLLSQLGESAMRMLLKVKRADAKAQNPSYLDASLRDADIAERILDEVIAQKACVTLQDLAISGDDLIAHGIPQGPLLGDILKRLLSLVLEEKLENRAELLITKAHTLHEGLKSNYLSTKTPK